MEKMSRRHLALVLDHFENTISFYVDGNLAGVGSSQAPADRVWISDAEGSGVGRMDCGQQDGYTGALASAYLPHMSTCFHLVVLCRS